MGSLLAFRRALGAQAEAAGSTGSSEADRAAPDGSEHTDIYEQQQHPHGQPGPLATRSLSPLCHRRSHGCCPCHAHARTPARTARGDMAQIPPLSTAHPAAGSAYLGRKDSKNPRCESSAGASLCQPFTQNKKRFSVSASQTSPAALPLPRRVCCLQPLCFSPGPGGKG